MKILRVDNKALMIQHHFVTELPDLSNEPECFYIGIVGEWWEVLDSNYKDPKFRSIAENLVRGMNSADPATAEYRLEVAEDTRTHDERLIVMVTKLN